MYKYLIFLYLLVPTVYGEDISSKHLINDIDYKNLKAYQALIEIPTGSIDKWEVNHKTGKLEWEIRDSKPRKVDFLGYIGNYGFIPQTLSGDSDPLDIIVLSSSVKRGDIIKVKILGMIKLLDHGEEDNKVIALLDNKPPFKDIDTLEEMLIKHPNVISMVRNWFIGYKKAGKMIFMGYETKNKTIAHIERAHKKWKKVVKITKN